MTSPSTATSERTAAPRCAAMLPRCGRSSTPWKSTRLSSTHDPANQTRLLPLALQGLSEPHTGQVPLAPASRLGRQLLRLVVGIRYKILLCVVMVYLRFRGGFSRRRPRRLLIMSTASMFASVIKVLATARPLLSQAFTGAIRVQRSVR